MGIRTLNTSSHVAKSANTRWRNNYCPLILVCWFLLLKIITSPLPFTIYIYIHLTLLIDSMRPMRLLFLMVNWFIQSRPVLGIFALEFEGPLLNVSHEMFHSFLHWSRKVSDLACLFAKVKRTIRNIHVWLPLKETYSMGKRWQSDDIWWLHRNFFEDLWGLLYRWVKYMLNQWFNLLSLAPGFTSIRPRQLYQRLPAGWRCEKALQISQALQETANWLLLKSYTPWPFMTCLWPPNTIHLSGEACTCTALMNFFTKSHDALVLHGAQSPGLHSTAEQPEDFRFNFFKCCHAIECSNAIVGLLCSLSV